MPRVLGVDGCRTGWAGIVWDGAQAGGAFASTLKDLVAAVVAAGPVDVVAVDMPIGLPDTGARRADIEAKRFLGAKGSSIFMTSVRAALTAQSRLEAHELNLAGGGAGVTAQSFALTAKIAEVDTFVRTPVASTLRIVEGHPELSFADMAGRVLHAPKRSWTGSLERRRALLAVGLDLDVDLGEVGRRAAADDVADAGSMAWTAMRVARGLATSRPSPPEVFSDGWAAAIWT